MNLNNSLLINVLAILIFTFPTLRVNAQIFGSEQAPPGVKWEQINHPDFQLIYPASIREEAAKIAAVIEHILPHIGKSLDRKPDKISIILQSNSVQSNGFVQLAPRRSEFFTTPPQNSDFQDWATSLAVHEMRHVVQFDKLSKGLKAPLFEELALAFFGITLPPWFYEGDAVGIETALSKAGRGRMPEWDLFYRTNTLSGQAYSYAKNYLGSMRDRTPGYYQLGYFMTSKLRRDFGADILDSIMTRISSRPFRPYNLSRALHDFTGMNTRVLHDSLADELNVLWKAKSSNQKTINYSTINSRTRPFPEDYLLPQKDEQGRTFALKESYARTPEIVRIDSSGNEELIIRIGSQTTSNFHYAAGKLVWDEYRYDSRYHKRSFNVLNSYNIQQSSYTQLTHQTRLFSPTLSPDGSKIAAVEIDLQNQNSIVEINALNGEVIRRYPNPDNNNLQTPSYHADGNRIVYVAVSQSGAAIMEALTEPASVREILRFQKQQIQRPVYANDLILFKAHYSGQDNIYGLNPDGDIFQLSQTEFSGINPSFFAASNQVLFNNYQRRGHDISSFNLETGKLPVQNTVSGFINYAEPIATQENLSELLDSIPTRRYEVEKYSDLNDLFYVHSLSPIAAERSGSEDRHIGLLLKSDNKLNTLSINAGYRYNLDLKESEFVSALSFRKFYPIIDLRYQNRARLTSIRQGVQVLPIQWREHFTELDISLPFAFNKRNQIYTFGIRSSTNLTSRYSISNEPANFIRRIQFPINYELFLNRNSTQSYRDLAPAWGQNISFRYFHLPFEENLSGTLFAFRSRFFTPGVFQNHSFQASFNYQENSGAFNFNVEIPRITGYNYALTLGSGLRNTLLLDYRFPIAYPDFELGTLAYIKRIKGGVFSDFENIGKDKAFRPDSFGLELSADMNLLRFYLPLFELSGRFILLPEKSNQLSAFELGFSYSL